MAYSCVAMILAVTQQTGTEESTVNVESQDSGVVNLLGMTPNCAVEATYCCLRNEYSLSVTCP